MTETRNSAPDLACGHCGAVLKWNPGADELACPYCGGTTAVPKAEAAVEELDFRVQLSEMAEGEAQEEVITSSCDACGAEVRLESNVVADACPFCSASIVRTSHSRRQVKPRSVLPFRVGEKEAQTAFQQWIRSLWFAPNALKTQARRERGIQGVYTPYWTYDSDTVTDYTGERGEYYYVTVSYTTTENGRTVVKQRQERRTRWYPASGRVRHHFDDVLVTGTDALPVQYCEALEPWDLDALVPYQDEYLSGFRALSYTVDLPTGFQRAQGVMEARIRELVRRDMGGDEQRIHDVRTRHSDITFKHLLLPVWMSAYRYRDRVYRFLVNARTGEVQGERPWSWIKIALAVLAALLVIGLVVWATQRSESGMAAASVALLPGPLGIRGTSRSDHGMTPASDRGDGDGNDRRRAEGKPAASPGFS